MYLITGLGNPGPRFENHRHNIGFVLLDRMASRHKSCFDRVIEQAQISLLEYFQEPVLLAKPLSFMNRSGPVVGGLVRRYDIDLEKLLVVYDDIALPLGKIRVRRAGSSGGQKGMESIIDTLQTQEIPRLRIGIRHGDPPLDYASYVLADFPRSEAKVLDEVLEHALRATETILSEGLDKAMAEFN